MERGNMDCKRGVAGSGEPQRTQTKTVRAEDEMQEEDRTGGPCSWEPGLGALSVREGPGVTTSALVSFTSHWGKQTSESEDRR